MFSVQGSKFATYQEEQEQLKADFHHAVEEGENEGEEGPGEKEGEEGEEGGGLLTLRKKGKEEMLGTVCGMTILLTCCVQWNSSLVQTPLGQKVMGCRDFRGCNIRK